MLLTRKLCNLNNLITLHKFSLIKFNIVSVNLLEIIQSQLGYPELQKMDPNQQIEKTETSKPGEHEFSQAAIPSILTALYLFSLSDEGAEKIIHGTNNTLWTDVIFGNNEKEILQKIADYSCYSNEITKIKMDKIAVDAVNIIQKKLQPEATIEDVKNILADQNSNVLLYLPAELQLGEMLNKGTLDDPTNKMEGPISSIMHVIGNQFSDDGDKKEVIND